MLCHSIRLISVRRLRVVGIALTTAFIIISAVAQGVSEETPASANTFNTLLANLGVIRITDRDVSLFLIPARDQSVLIDCGFDQTGTAILRTLRAQGLMPQDITAVFITHLHADHIAACHLFKQAHFYGMGTPDAVMTAVHGHVAREAVESLHDGQSIAAGTTIVKAYSAPGHTPDSAAYLIRDVLFLGDAATLNEQTGELNASPLIFNGAEQYPDSNRLNVGALKRLYRRLVSEGQRVRVVAMAHSNPVQDFRLLDTAR